MRRPILPIIPSLLLLRSIRSATSDQLIILVRCSPSPVSHITNKIC